MKLQIAFTAMNAAVVGLMIFDQRRLQQMTPMKWLLAALLFSVLTLNVWI